MPNASVEQLNRQASPENETAGKSFTLPTPDQVKRTFVEHVTTSTEDAVRYLYDLGLISGYIRAEDIARNICWTADSAYGPLEITINLSKPEKDPRAIAASASTPVATHAPTSANQPAPQCALCWENEGWLGSPKIPAKPLLRIAPITLGDEPWGLQYSPYSYYQEHCIALSREHRPMSISPSCFNRLLDFVDQFPFYFVGSNADLPIVGGSILSHDHFQGGRHEFPLMKAPITRQFAMPAYPDVRCGIVNWPASTVRLESENREQLLAAATSVLNAWRDFSCEECDIASHSKDGTPHNTISPIVRKNMPCTSSAPNSQRAKSSTSSAPTAAEPTYIFDLILRNNRTTEQRPWGLFHPREEYHHIKKENIGLIEAMGLAILPPRLACELPAVQALLHEAARGALSPEKLRQRLLSSETTESHTRWAMDVFARLHANLREEASKPHRDLSPIMKEEVGDTFARILEDVAVFKQNEAGNRGWNSFLEALSATPR